MHTMAICCCWICCICCCFCSWGTPTITTFPVFVKTFKISLFWFAGFSSVGNGIDSKIFYEKVNSFVFENFWLCEFYLNSKLNPNLQTIGLTLHLKLLVVMKHEVVEFVEGEASFQIGLVVVLYFETKKKKKKIIQNERKMERKSLRKLGGKNCWFGGGILCGNGATGIP